MDADYDGRQVVGIDLHRRRSVIVRMTEAGERLGVVRIDNDPMTLAAAIAEAGEHPDVVLGGHVRLVLGSRRIAGRRRRRAFGASVGN